MSMSDPQSVFSVFTALSIKRDSASAVKLAHACRTYSALPNTKLVISVHVREHGSRVNDAPVGSQGCKILCDHLEVKVGVLRPKPLHDGHGYIRFPIATLKEQGSKGYITRAYSYAVISRGYVKPCSHYGLPGKCCDCIRMHLAYICRCRVTNGVKCAMLMAFFPSNINDAPRGCE